VPRKPDTPTDSRRPSNPPDVPYFGEENISNGERKEEREFYNKL
jgi:hypothetical protein